MRDKIKENKEMKLERRKERRQGDEFEKRRGEHEGEGGYEPALLFFSAHSVDDSGGSSAAQSSEIFISSPYSYHTGCLHWSREEEQAVSDLKEQLKSDLKSLQDTRDKYEEVEEKYNEMIQVSKKQLSSTEKQIRAEFNKLHQFLKEEEESRLAALREEEEQKGKTMIVLVFGSFFIFSLTFSF
ncbi:hypothetical protein PAMP_021866 [Pampus punctatissimus]